MRLCYSPSCTYCNRTFILIQRKAVFPAYELVYELSVFCECYLCVYVCCRCMIDFICSRKIYLFIFIEFKILLWILRLCKECTIEHWIFCSQRKECASELYGVRKERVRRAHQSDHKLKRNLRVTEYSVELHKCALSGRKECVIEIERNQDSRGRPVQGLHQANT
jgi:hypothetical protein